MHAGLLRLLPAPLRPYAPLRDDVVARGWQWSNESQAPPMIAGEPEWVRYRHPEGGVLDYEFSPVHGLRSIVAEGPPDLLVPLTDLPRLGPHDLGPLLDGDPTDVLRGLAGVAALRWLPLLGRVREVASDHPDPVVRAVAADVAARLPADAEQDVIGRVRALREARPGRSALLAMMPVADRRQVLRWIGADRRDATPGALEALRTGLADDDPETRVTAALVAARIGARDVLREASTVTVPELLVPALRAALGALQTGSPLVVPDPIGAQDVLLSSLVLPLPDIPQPRSLPRHLSDDDGLRLRCTGLPVALVPATPHRLGAGVTVTLTPFVVTRAPVDVGTARLLGLPAAGADADPFLATEATAADLAGRLGELEEWYAEVVGPQRWEASLRGPDGRRFTAGNLEPAIALSPWGALAVPGVRERLADGCAADCADLGTVVRADPDEALPVRLAGGFPV